MKYRSLIAGILAVCLSLCACGAETDTFDAEKEGILKVIVFDEEAEVLSYDIIGTNGRRMAAEQFDSSALTILTADPGCFQSSVKDGKVINEVVSVDVYNEDGGQVVPDSTVIAIFTQTATLHDQEIFALDIIMCDGRYFPVVELRMDQQAPTILYYFNTETQTMTELCRYDSAVIGGMQIIDPDNLP